MSKAGGKFLPPQRWQHTCKTPWVKLAQVGTNWQCQADVRGLLPSEVETCDKLWVVERMSDNQKHWVTETDLTTEEHPVDAKSVRERLSDRSFGKELEANVPKQGSVSLITALPLASRSELDYWLSDHFGNDPGKIQGNWLRVADFLIERYDIRSKP
jgi:hypothetical protein